VHPFRTAQQKGSKHQVNRLIVGIQLFLKDDRGQDLIEYAMMAGFVALAAGALMPGISTSISTVFSKVANTMTAAAS
jgi:Flp pilus assembly pilin Flp